MDRDLIASLWQMIEPILDPEGIELVELVFKFEGGHWVLRLYIDRPEGVTIDDCQLVSKQVGALLDMKDPITQSYNLEVSSPGINRVIRKEKDFVRFAGSPVTIRTKTKIEGRKKFTGTLQGVEDTKVIVEINGQPMAVPLDQVDTARLNLPDSEIFRQDLRRGAAGRGD